MSTHTHHTEHNETYFCTITCYKWLSLIEEANAYDAVYNWFNHLIKDGCQVCAYVIMPNHIHILLFPTRLEKSLSKLVGEGKRFLAYDIVKRLKSLGKIELLNQLEEVWRQMKWSRVRSIKSFVFHLMPGFVWIKK